MFEIFLHYTEKMTRFLIACRHYWCGFVESLTDVWFMLDMYEAHTFFHTFSKKIHCTTGLNFVDYRDN